MTPRNDKYDLSQPSQTGKAGFGTLQRGALHYFHFNDKKGDALLFSQEYQSQESRNNGILAVKKNAPNPKRYEVRTEKNKFYFLLKAGNNQEIARSRLLDSKLALDKAIEYLASYPFVQALPEAPAVEQSASKPSPPAVSVPEQELARFKSLYEAEHLEKKRIEADLDKLNAQIQQLKKDNEAKQKTAQTQKVALQEAVTSGKHSFRLEFYEEKDEPVRGRVEHLNTQKKQTFQGLDWEAIVNFIAGYVWQEKPGDLKLSVFPVSSSKAANAQGTELLKEPSKQQPDQAPIGMPKTEVEELGTPQKGGEIQQEAQMIASEASPPPPPPEKLPQSSAQLQAPNNTQHAFETLPEGTKKYRLETSPEGKIFFRTRDGQAISLEDFRKKDGRQPNAVPSPVSATPASSAQEEGAPEENLRSTATVQKPSSLPPPLQNMEDRLISWMEEAPEGIGELNEFDIETYSNYGVQPGKNFNVSEYIYFQPLPLREFENPTLDYDFEVKVKPMSGRNQTSEVKRVWVRKSPDKQLLFISGMSAPGLYRLYVNTHLEKKAWHGTAIVNVL